MAQGAPMQKILEVAALGMAVQEGTVSRTARRGVLLMAASFIQSAWAVAVVQVTMRAIRSPVGLVVVW